MGASRLWGYRRYRVLWGLGGLSVCGFRTWGGLGLKGLGRKG